MSKRNHSLRTCLALALLGCQATPQLIAASWRRKLDSKQSWISVTVSGKEAESAWKAQAAEVCGGSLVPVAPLEVVTTTRGEHTETAAQGWVQCAAP